MTNATTLEMIRRQAEDSMDGPAPVRPAAPPDASTICPYCGHRERANAEECSECRGLFEPLSRIATQNAMGPWQLRDEANPFRPGCSIETLRALIGRGKLTRETVLRGPTTRQYWMRAAEIRGVAHFLGVCYACKGQATAKDHFCRSCGASFVAESDRNWLGLDAVRPLSATPMGAHVETESKTAAGAEVQREPQAAGSGFLDVFSGPTTGAAAPASPSIRSGGRARRQRARAVRQAIAAATIALCAAALSVAVWAASAAHAVNSRDAAPEPGAAGVAQPIEAPAAVSAESGQGDAAAPSEATPSVPESWNVRLTAALALSESEDIKSLEQAVQILRQLQREAPQAAAAEGLSDRIEALERRVDDLTIRKFLRKDS